MKKPYVYIISLCLVLLAGCGKQQDGAMNLEDIEQKELGVILESSGDSATEFEGETSEELTHDRNPAEPSESSGAITESKESTANDINLAESEEAQNSVAPPQSSTAPSENSNVPSESKDNTANVKPTEPKSSAEASESSVDSTESEENDTDEKPSVPEETKSPSEDPDESPSSSIADEPSSSSKGDEQSASSFSAEIIDRNQYETLDNVFLISPEVSEDGIIKVTLSLYGKVKLCAFDLDINFDPNVLSIINVNSECGLSVVEAHDEQAGVISCNYANAKNIKKQKDILIVEFRVVGNASETQVSITPKEIIRVIDGDIDTESAPYTLTTGSFIEKETGGER